MGSNEFQEETMSRTEQNMEKAEHNKSIWWHNSDNLHTLCRHLIDTELLKTPDMVLDFFQRPWIYNSEWQKYTNN